MESLQRKIEKIDDQIYYSDSYEDSSEDDEKDYKEQRQLLKKLKQLKYNVTSQTIHESSSRS